MDKEQRTYMQERLDRIFHDHLEDIQKETEKELEKIPTAQLRFVEALEKSKDLQAKVLAHLAEYLKGMEGEALDDDLYEEFRNAEKQDKGKVYDKGRERRDELMKEFWLLRDRCMLTDDGDTLCKLIKSFESKSF